MIAVERERELADSDNNFRKMGKFHTILRLETTDPAPCVESPNAHRTAWTKRPGSDINLERVSTRRVESLHTENREDSYLKPRRMKRTTHAHTHTEKKKGDPAAKTCPCAPSCSCATFALSLGKGGECIYTSKSSAAMTTTSIGPELFFLPPAPPISILY